MYYHNSLNLLFGEGFRKDLKNIFKLKNEPVDIARKRKSQ